MSTWTLEEAKKHLQSWLEADYAVATGKRYRIGEKELTRAEVAEIRERITFWSREIQKLELGIRSNNRVIRVVPRDL